MEVSRTVTQTYSNKPNISTQQWTTQQGGTTKTTKVTKTNYSSGSRITGQTNVIRSGASRVITSGGRIRRSGAGGGMTTTTTYGTTGGTIRRSGAGGGMTTTTTYGTTGGSTIRRSGAGGGTTTTTTYGTTGGGAIRGSGAGVTTTTTTSTYNNNLLGTGIRKSGRKLQGSVVAITEHPEQSYVVSEGRQIGAGKIVAETYTEGTSETVRVEEGKHIIIDHKPGEKIIKQADLTGYEEEAVIVEEVEEVEVEVIIEKKVPVNVYVDVPYDVIVKVPKKRIIEKEIIIEKIKEVPYEKIIEVPVEKIIEVPVETIEEVIVEVPVENRVPYETVVEHLVPNFKENVIYHDGDEVIDIKDLVKYKNDPRVVRVEPTDVRIHENVVVKEVDDIQTNVITEVFYEPTYKYEENIVEVDVDAPYTVVDEVAVLNVGEIDKVVENIIENPVEQPYDVVNEEAHLECKDIDKHVVNIIDVEVEDPYTVEKLNDVAVFNNKETNHEVINHIPNHVFDSTNVVKKVVVEIDKPIALAEVGTQQFEVSSGVPQQVKPEISVQDVEYHIQKERPISEDQIIEVVVPNVIKNEEESLVEVEVPCKVVIEQAVAVEKAVEVEVVNKIEKAVYKDKLTEKKVPFNVVIEREVEVVEEEIVEVEVEKIIEVPVKITRKNPVEKQEYFETDINVNTVVTEPVQGGELETKTVEIPNKNLEDRILEMKQEINGLTEENREYQIQYSSLKLDTGLLSRYNDLLRKTATSTSTLHELEAKKDILHQDIQRLQDVEREFGVGQEIIVEYVTPHRDLERLARELRMLVDENRSLVKRVKQACPQ